MLEVVDPPLDIQKYLTLQGYKEPQDLIIDYPEAIKFDGVKYELDSKTFEVFADDCLRELRGLSGKMDLRPYNVTLINYPAKPRQIKTLRNADIGKLINVDCVVRKVSEIRQEIIWAGYRCAECDSPIQLFKVDKTMRIPPWARRCPQDENHKKIYLDPERCLYRDIQYVTIQDLTAEHGRQPRSINAVVPGIFCDKLTPGNRCKITAKVKVEVDKDNIACIYLECCNVEKAVDDYCDIVVTPEDIEEITKLAAREDIFKALSESINPSIYGYDSIKLALVLQMFGGVTCTFDDGSKQRGDSHVLLCGDPSMAKSQLIRSVYNIVPRGVYASGRSTSGAGLTAAAIKDELDGKWTLEAGAMVLANGGMCIIDELDKMREEDRSALHEAMESQTISFNKAGISEKLETVCSVLAAANPIDGKFIPEQDIIKQIDLPPSLMSRFDLIFSMIDVPNNDIDDSVAQHVLQTRAKATSGEIVRPISIDMMRKYVTYAKTINPIITKESQDYLRSMYKSFRANKESYITVRQLEALERLTESAARIKLRSETTLEDAKMAVQLFKMAMKSVTLSDTMDVSCIYGTSTVRQTNIEKRLYELLKDSPWELRLIRNEIMRGTDFSEKEINQCVFALEKNGKLNIDREQTSIVVSWKV